MAGQKIMIQDPEGTWVTVDARIKPQSGESAGRRILVPGPDGADVSLPARVRQTAEPSIRPAPEGSIRAVIESPGVGSPGPQRRPGRSITLPDTAGDLQTIDVVPRGVTRRGSMPRVSHPQRREGRAPSQRGYWGRTAANLPRSLAAEAWNIAAPIHSPWQTLKGLGSALGSIPGLVLDPEDQTAENNTLKALWADLVKSYGSGEAVKRTIEKNPGRVLTDIASIVSLGSLGAAKTAGAAASTAARLGMAGTAGAARGVERAARAGDRIGAAIDLPAHLLRPARGAARWAASRAQRATARRTAERAGVPTRHISTMYELGRRGRRDPESRIALEQMERTAPVTDVADMLKTGVEARSRELTAVRDEVRAMGDPGMEGRRMQPADAPGAYAEARAQNPTVRARWREGPQSAFSQSDLGRARERQRVEVGEADRDPAVAPEGTSAVDAAASRVVRARRDLDRTHAERRAREAAESADGSVELDDTMRGIFEDEITDQQREINRAEHQIAAAEEADVALRTSEATPEQMRDRRTGIERMLREGVDLREAAAVRIGEINRQLDAGRVDASEVRARRTPEEWDQEISRSEAAVKEAEDTYAQAVRAAEHESDLRDFNTRSAADILERDRMTSAQQRAGRAALRDRQRDAVERVASEVGELSDDGRPFISGRLDPYIPESVRRAGAAVGAAATRGVSRLRNIGVMERLPPEIREVITDAGEAAAGITGEIPQEVRGNLRGMTEYGAAQAAEVWRRNAPELERMWRANAPNVRRWIRDEMRNAAAAGRAEFARVGDLKRGVRPNRFGAAWRMREAMADPSFGANLAQEAVRRRAGVADLSEFPGLDEAVKRPVDFDKWSLGIEKEISDNFGHLNLTPQQSAFRNSVREILSEYKKADPDQFHTVAGVQALYDALKNHADETPGGKTGVKAAVLEAAKRGLYEQAPPVYRQFIDRMKATQDALKDARAAFTVSGGSGATREHVVHKFAGMDKRRGPGAQYRSQLARSLDIPGIEGALAGVALSDDAPRRFTASPGGLAAMATPGMMSLGAMIGGVPGAMAGAGVGAVLGRGSYALRSPRGAGRAAFGAGSLAGSLPVRAALWKLDPLNQRKVGPLDLGQRISESQEELEPFYDYLDEVIAGTPGEPERPPEDPFGDARERLAEILSQTESPLRSEENTGRLLAEAEAREAERLALEQAFEDSIGGAPGTTWPGAAEEPPPEIDPALAEILAGGEAGVRTGGESRFRRLAEALGR